MSDKEQKVTKMQKKVIELWLDHGGEWSKRKILKKAGYSDAVAKNPKKVFESKAVSDKIKEFEERLDEHINLALEKMKDKVDDARYSDLSKTVERFKKLNRLEQDKSTEKVQIVDDLE